MQKEMDFLLEHKNADVIVVDTETGLPYSAEYLYLDARVRDFPEIYYYPEY